MTDLAVYADRSVSRNHSGAESDAQLIELWLSRFDSAETRSAYQRDVARLFESVGVVPLHTLTVGDLQAWAAEMTADGLKPATRARRLSAVKSLLSFGQHTGYLPFNVGAAVKAPKRLNDLAERILTQEQVVRLITAARSPRDRALLRFLYVSGARVSEACALDWEHVHTRDDKCQVTLHGKGGKTRHVLVTASVAADLYALRSDVLDEGAVFRMRDGKRMNKRTAQRIVKRTAKRAGLPRRPSPHWLRHAHASHAMDRGAPLHLVQATLGHASAATTSRYLHARPGESSGMFLGV